MSKFYVFAVSDIYGGLKGDSYDTGACVSRHKEYSTADKRCDKLGKKYLEWQAFVVIESDQDFQPGQHYPELIAEWKSAEERKDKINWLSEIMLAEKEGDEKRLRDAVEMVSIKGWSLDQLKSEFTEDSQQVIDAEESRKQALAAERARIRANKDSLAKSRDEVTYTFPAVRGVQAGQEYYTAQVPIKFLIKLFRFDEEDVPVELRAQRTLNEKRAKAISSYILSNRDSYVLPAITACVSSAMSFEPTPVAGASDRLGLLNIPLDAMLLIVDGQHRRKGVEFAVQECPELKEESMAVTLYFDQGLKHNQQMFSDINCSVVKPSTAISSLYNHRCEFGRFVKELLDTMPMIKSRVEMEASSVGKKSYKLWSLISFQKFITQLFYITKANYSEIMVEDEYRSAAQKRDDYMEVVRELFKHLSHIPQWSAMLNGSISAVEVRDEFITGHAVFLEAIGIFASRYITTHSKGDSIDWSHLEKLSDLDVMKTSPIWEGRCVVLGKMNKTADGVKGTAALLCNHLGLSLTPELERVDQRLKELETV